MKQLKLVLAFVLVVFLLPACSDSDDDLLWLPGNTPAAEEVDDGNDDNGTGDEDPQGYGILLAAPREDASAASFARCNSSCNAYSSVMSLATPISPCTCPELEW